jgi:4-alpha-glucanotransferase
VEAFCRENAGWLENYTLYTAVKAHFEMKSWNAWPDEEIRKHRPEAVRRYGELLRDEVEFYRFVQFLFFRQWKALKAYAQEKGVLFIGDIPIYVAMDSADIWAEPQFFQLDSDGVPKEVAGVPPDPFTADGQLWGNPLYDWEKMKADGYGWWIRRIEGATKLFDVLRIDHFRGMESYWAVPYGDKTAKNGKWRQGPGMSLVGVLTSWFHGTNFIAEDLGYLTPEVRQLLKNSGLPGMRVMEFAFDAHGESDYLPHRCNENSVCYLGTHDNDTILGYYNDLPEEEKELWDKAIAKLQLKGETIPEKMIRYCLSKDCAYAVIALQDLLGLDGKARINVPGIIDDVNWTWRLVSFKPLEDKIVRLGELNKEYGRR